MASPEIAKMNKKILVVDDDRDVLIGLNARLRSAGYATVFASDALAAVRMARTEEPDLILLDIGLPAGGGFTVLDRLRQNASLSFIPVFVISARDPEEIEKKALDAGARLVFSKPFDHEALLRQIEGELH
jgi:DNA-binding response OmpR family regulator